MAFKMKGPSLYKGTGGMGVKGVIKNQKDYAGQADGRATSSPFQQKEEEKPKNPEVNQWGETPEEYKQRMIDMGLQKPPAPPAPTKQRVTKGGEGQDENKIFDKDGNHVGDWVDGKKVMKKQAFSKKKGELKRTLTSNIKNR